VGESPVQLADGAVAGARQMCQEVRLALVQAQAGALDVKPDLMSGPMNPGNQEQRHAHYLS
jgi:hypothetical protein